MAGIGSRLRPHTLTTPKPLTVIAGKTIVERLVENITKVVSQKIEEIAFIIGSLENGFPADTSKKLIKITEKLGVKGTIYVQKKALGTAHAVFCAAKSLKGPCVVAFADTLFKADFVLDTSVDGTVWVKKVENPSAFGVVKLKNGIITNFIEKPKNFVSDLAIIGIYYFKNGEKVKSEIQYLIDNDLKEHGEYQLTNVLESLNNKGAKFTAGKVNHWMDCGVKDSIVYSNKQILSFEYVAGKDLVSKSIKSKNSKIIQPCFIGENAELENAKIGPYVSLGANSVIKNSTIVNSLIQSNVKISNANLDNSMIGNHSKFDGNFTSINIGDYNELK